MPVYLIPSEKDIKNYLDEYETEGMSKEGLLCYIYDIIDGFRSFYPVIDFDVFFYFDVKKDIAYKTLIKNVIPFLVLNNICRVYYADFGDGNPHYELFPNSESNQDGELFLVLKNNPAVSEPSITKEIFESSYTRLEKNGNYIPVKV